MVLGGKWWPLENVRADECKGRVRMMSSAVAGRTGRADVGFRWCYGPWDGERLVALSVDVLEEQSLGAPWWLHGQTNTRWSDFRDKPS